MGDDFLRQRGALSRVTCIIDKSERYKIKSKRVDVFFCLAVLVLVVFTCKN